MTPADRLAIYRRGYGDGAKGSAHMHPGHADYLRGWRAGNADAAASALAFCEQEGIALPSPCRESVEIICPGIAIYPTMVTIYPMSFVPPRSNT